MLLLRPWIALVLVFGLPSQASATCREDLAGLVSTYDQLDKESRRPIDAKILEHLHPAVTIAAVLSRGATCLEAYQAHLDRIQSLFSSPHRRYGAEDVLNVLRILQEWHRTLPADESIRTRPNSFQNGRKEMIVYGSFPLGKASLSESDVDFRTIGTARYESSHLRAIEFQLGEVESRIRDHFARRGRASSLRVSGRPFLDKRHMELSPLLFVLDDSVIRLQVYSQAAFQTGILMPLIDCVLD